jgi:adenosylcobinamide-GDP ribazoletransferase
MRDSRIGTYGVLALILATVLRIAAVAGLANNALAGLVVAATLSRAVMAWPMALLPPARDDGLATSAGTPPWGGVIEGALIALVLALVISGSAGILAAATAAFAALSVAWLVGRAIGGVTGDVIGAAQVLAEIAALLALVALSD